MAIALIPNSVTVLNYSTQVLPENPNRQGCVLTNVGPGNVSIGLGFEAVQNRGITLIVGNTFSMDAMTVCTSQINAISISGSAVISIQEWN